MSDADEVLPTEVDAHRDFLTYTVSCQMTPPVSAEDIPEASVQSQRLMAAILACLDANAFFPIPDAIVGEDPNRILDQYLPDARGALYRDPCLQALLNCLEVRLSKDGPVVDLARALADICETPEPNSDTANEASPSG